MQGLKALLIFVFSLIGLLSVTLLLIEPGDLVQAEPRPMAERIGANQPAMFEAASDTDQQVPWALPGSFATRPVTVDLIDDYLVIGSTLYDPDCLAQTWLQDCRMEIPITYPDRMP